jgi:hypothetical protein
MVHLVAGEITYATAVTLIAGGGLLELAKYLASAVAGSVIAARQRRDNHHVLPLEG